MNNSITKILPDIKFGVGSQASKQLYFQTALRKIKCQNFQNKTQNALIRGLFYPNMSKNEFSANIMFCQFFDHTTM